MAELKAGEPFGLNPAMSAKIDWNLALERIIQDLRTDFIYAPHLGFIYRRAGDELVNQVKAQLSAGQYSPGLPVTIEVPKPFRIRVTSTLPRLGPNYSRPGSILLPSDRIFYQALADHAAPLVKAKSDWTRSFGDHSRRKDLGAIYASVSEYVKAAVYYSSRRWPMAERSNAKVIWGNHGPLNKLITVALTKK